MRESDPMKRWREGPTHPQVRDGETRVLHVPVCTRAPPTHRHARTHAHTCTHAHRHAPRRSHLASASVAVASNLLEGLDHLRVSPTTSRHDYRRFSPLPVPKTCTHARTHARTHAHMHKHAFARARTHTSDQEAAGRYLSPHHSQLPQHLQ
jgi:hypothetical protein